MFSFGVRDLSSEVRLKVFPELSEPFYLKQAQTVGRGVHLFMLQYPGIVVRDENRVDSRRQGGIDIRPWAVSDHPRRSRLQLIFANDAFVGRGILLGHDLHGGEEFL